VHNLYSILFTNPSKKDLKSIDKSHQSYIKKSLSEFINNFNDEYERSLMQKGKIKKLQGQKEVLYRLKLRSYRVIYKKINDELIILVVTISTREGAYKLHISSGFHCSVLGFVVFFLMVKHFV